MWLLRCKKIGSKGNEVQSKNPRREEQESGVQSKNPRREEPLTSSEVDVDEPAVAEQGAMVDGASNGSSKESPLQPQDFSIYRNTVHLKSKLCSCFSPS